MTLPASGVPDYLDPEPRLAAIDRGGAVTDALSYRNDPDLKARLVANMRSHQKADRLVQGDYFGESRAGRPNGCAVGCTVADFLAAERGISLSDLPSLLRDEPIADPGWHKEWARVTGLPEWLAHLDDFIFESLEAQVVEWPLRLLEAIPVGVDLATARDAWLVDVVSAIMAEAATALEIAGLASAAKRLSNAPPPARLVELAEARKATLAAIRATEVDNSLAWALADAAADTARFAIDAALEGDATAAGQVAEGAMKVARPDWLADRLIHHLESASPATSAEIVKGKTA